MIIQNLGFLGGSGGFFERALHFDGGDDYVSMTSKGQGAASSYCIWFNLDTLGGNDLFGRSTLADVIDVNTNPIDQVRLWINNTLEADFRWDSITLQRVKRSPKRIKNYTFLSNK